MTFDKPQYPLPSITPTRLQLFTVVIAASFAAALLLAIIACSPEPPQPTPTSTAVPTYTPTPRPTATREPLDPKVRYNLSGQAGNEFSTYAKAIAEGTPPEEADRDVEAWMMAREGHKGSKEVVDFLLTAGISENAILIEDLTPCYIYVIARVPVSLLRPLDKHPYMLILTLGPKTSAESLPSEPTAPAVAPIQKPVCLPDATPSAEAGGMAQEAMDLMKLQSLYAIQDTPLTELADYFEAIDRGVSSEDADRDVQAWIAVEGGDAGTRAVSEFLRINGISEDSLRLDKEWLFSYIVAQVPVSLLIRLSQHPNVIYVGDRVPTVFEKESFPAVSTATPAPTPTPSDARPSQQPLKPVQKYGLTGAPFDELRIYLDALARGASPENADKKVQTWILVGDDAGIQAISEFLLTNGVSENSLRIVSEEYMTYIVAQVPVPLLIPLSEHPHALHVGDRIPTEVEPRDPSLDFSPTPTPTPTPTPSNTPTPTPTVTPTPPLTPTPTPTPTTTPTPPSDTAGTAQQPLKQLEYYGLTGKPFEALGIYLDEIASGASGNADVEVETWIWVAGDAGIQAISEFLLANGVSEYSIRADSYFTYVVANVPVRLLIPLAEHPHQLNVGDRLPTEVEPRDPSLDFSPTPTPTETSTPTPTAGVGTATPTTTPPPAQGQAEESTREYPKLDSGLMILFREYEAAVAEGASGQSVASIVAVELYTVEDREHVIAFLDRHEIAHDVTLLGKQGSFGFLAYVPVSLLGPLSEVPGVRGMLLAGSPVPAGHQETIPTPTSGSAESPTDTPCSYPKLFDGLEAEVCAQEGQTPADPPKTVAVEVYTNGDSSTIVEFLQANGAIEDRAGVDERSAFHYSDFGDELAVSFIPLTLLGALSELPAVDFIIRPPIAVPAAISTRAFV